MSAMVRLWRRCLWVLPPVALAAACAVAYYAGTQKPKTLQWPLAIDPQHLDFGEVWLRPRLVWTVPVQNRSDQPVTVGSVTVSCCDAVEPGSFVVPPHESVLVRMSINLESG